MDSDVSQSMDPSKVALVELHDGRIDDVLVDGNGRACVRFVQLSVYVEKSRELYDIWICGAELLLYGVRRLVVNGAQCINDRIVDGTFYDSNGQEVDPALLLRSQGASRVVLTIFGGASIEVEFESAIFQKLVPREKLEEWFGPLATS